MVQSVAIFIGLFLATGVAAALRTYFAGNRIWFQLKAS
jgi:hypothetical protein